MSLYSHKKKQITEKNVTTEFRGEGNSSHYGKIHEYNIGKLTKKTEDTREKKRRF